MFKKIEAKLKITIEKQNDKNNKYIPTIDLGNEKLK